MSMNLSQFVPAAQIGPLAWLGRHKGWMKCQRSGDRFTLSTDKTVLDGLSSDQRRSRPPEFWAAVRSLLNKPYANDRDLLQTYSLSRAAALGPKVFRPLALQCLALENSDPDLPWDDYQQGDEVLFIEFPDEYRQQKIAGGLKRCPRYLICWFDPDVGAIVVTCQFDSMNDRIVSVLAKRDDAETINDMLQLPLFYENDGTSAEDNQDFIVAALFERLAINLNLIMTYGGGTITYRPTDPAEIERIRRERSKYKKRSGPKAAATMASLDAQRANLMTQVVFDKEIAWWAEPQVRTVLPDDRTEAPREANYGPHIRKGHFRRQPYGPRTNPSYDRIYIRPKFIVPQAYRHLNLDPSQFTRTWVQRGDPVVLPAGADTEAPAG